jgi:hypothetical protein
MRRSAATFVFVAALLATAPAICSDTPPEMKPLTSASLKKTITDHTLSYNPAGWADTGMSEAFFRGGKWVGTNYGRGVLSFGGRWYVKDDQLCVVEDQRSVPWAGKPYCRTVWQDPSTGQLAMDYLGGSFGLQALSVQPIVPYK